MNKTVEIIGTPSTFGQRKLGVNLGPDAIRYAGIVARIEAIGLTVKDSGNINVPELNLNKFNSEQQGLRNLEEIIETSETLSQSVSNSISNNHFPLILGGDHSIAIGSISGVSKHYENLGVIWYDAHGDLNIPEESPSGNIHGMPLRILAGDGDDKLVNIANYAPKVKPENIVLIGMRDLDVGERQYIKDNNIKTYTMAEVDRYGIKQVIKETIDYLKEKTDGIHLSLDVDALDPVETPGTGTRVLGGLTYRESHFALEFLHNSNLVTSMDLVEVNPLIDHNNDTAEQAVGLVGSFFGETLL
ncbi:arginase [Staphylococcus saprophyticus]|uniref:Arginase n=3 Tax=Staphylococcus TaxID=1279 RepID=Q49ZB0_STAS1|nr:arginase [Staphylococcus saprophyticus]ASF19802.1 arginase [Staphylococcus saprophyticus]MDW3918202.1 arginase [Staphylococcus saprophyticus]OOC98581.1 arginase [Staphylococcus saprophyticus subsp. saprophyticus ATCC 15305 = NCTC 7292]QCY41990.1 arginase [Staphylococcus saprophyticus subsp. saprophyticus ATCC 15305 = NCTC 7292]RTX67394.1 arginase [Staphylococcus saprophyticus]